MVAAAVAFAKEQIGKPPRRIGEKKIDKASIPAGLFEKARASLARHPSGPIAPKAAIDAVEAATTLPLAEGNARERQVFREAAASPYARALQYAFFAERQAANLPGIGPDTKLRDVKTVGILGAGTMGTGIALAFLNGGFPVTIVETTQEALDRGVDRIKDTLVGQRQARAHHRSRRPPTASPSSRPLSRWRTSARPTSSSRPCSRTWRSRRRCSRSSTKSPSRAPSSPPTPPRSTSTRSPP